MNSFQNERVLFGAGLKEVGRLFARPGRVGLTLALLLSSIVHPLAAAEEPALPIGLDGHLQSSEPALPTGLDSGGPSEEPQLPNGLEEDAGTSEPAFPSGLSGPDPDDLGAADAPTFDEPFLDFSGFWEARGGVRTQNDPNQEQESLAETRIQTELAKSWSAVTFHVTTDLLFDAIPDERRVDLEAGDGFLDLREANLLLRPTSFLDLKVGRQILTWGVGDLVFINDLFPKDWVAFLAGRDTEYLKAPSDVLKVSLFSKLANVDLVYTPRFDSDRIIDGKRISYFSPLAGQRVGHEHPLVADLPDRWFDDDEMAVRIYRSLGAYELALYGYTGFWKSPSGFDTTSGKAIFSELSVYGASIRGPLYRGIFHMEGGYYDSADDRPGDNPLLKNSEVRILAGYEQELARNFTAGIQYYLEHMLRHADYERTLPPGMAAADEDRHLVTLRLTRLLLNQNLMLSLFVFYSPSDSDGYLRPRVNYKLTDQWTLEAGGNVFAGKRDHTFFGQFEKNTNVYASVRFGF